MKILKQNIINYIKIIGIYLNLIFILSAIPLSIYLLISASMSIDCADTAIDDRYGSLDTNTEKVIKEEITKIMKDKRTNIYFSYVYNDINETYKESLYSGKNYIFFYYNKNNNTLKVLSDIKYVKELNLCYNVENNDIVSPFRHALKSIKKIDKQSNKLFYETIEKKAFVMLFSAFLCMLMPCYAVLFINSKKIKRILKKCKDEIRENAIKNTNENDEKDCTEEKNEDHTEYENE